MGSRFLKFVPVTIWGLDTSPRSAGLYQVIECDDTVPSLSTVDWEPAAAEGQRGR